MSLDEELARWRRAEEIRNHEAREERARELEFLRTQVEPQLRKLYKDAVRHGIVPEEWVEYRPDFKTGLFRKKPELRRASIIGVFKDATPDGAPYSCYISEEGHLLSGSQLIWAKSILVSERKADEPVPYPRDRHDYSLPFGFKVIFPDDSEPRFVYTTMKYEQDVDVDGIQKLTSGIAYRIQWRDFRSESHGRDPYYH